MATMKVELDTETGVMETWVNDELITNVNSIEAYVYSYSAKPEVHFCVSTFERVDDDLSKQGRICASEGFDQAKAKAKRVAAKPNDVQSAIAKYFGESGFAATK
jgi:hypothetical protein